MTRLEIAVRLMEASYRKSDMMTVTLTPENALDIADRLRAEDAKRTAAETSPDRPAKEAKPCEHRHLVRDSFDVGGGARLPGLVKCKDCGKEIDTPPPPKPAARWRPASERPEGSRTIIVKLTRLHPYGFSISGKITVAMGWHNNGWFDVGRTDGDKPIPDGNIEGWLYASEVIPE